MVLLWAGVPDISRFEIPHGEFRISYPHPQNRYLAL